MKKAGKKGNQEFWKAITILIMGVIAAIILIMWYKGIGDTVLK